MMALPSGYTALKYIESSGTQYIDTGFKPNQNTRVDMDLEILSTTASVSVVLGVRTSDFAAPWFGVVYRETYLRSDYGSAQLNLTPTAIHDRAKLSHDKNIFSFGEVSVTNTASTFTCTNSLFLLAYSNGGAGGNPVNAKLYSCQIYDNGTLVRDFVPAQDGSGVVGLYDQQNGVFYANAGSGSFTGESMTGPVEGVGVCIIDAVSFAINAGKCKLNGVIKDVTEGMAMVGGVAKKIALNTQNIVEALAVKYTGSYTDQLNVVMSGKTYRLLTLTSSGTLSIDNSVSADIWMVGGGNGGYYHGGAGGYSLFAQNVSLPVKNTAVIGSGGQAIKFGGSSKFNSYSTSNPYTSGYEFDSFGKNGGTGGGVGYASGHSGVAGTGDGITKYPFTDSSYFTKCCSGGGGGGGEYNNDNGSYNGKSGGNGGTNGGKGSVGSGKYGYGGGGGKYGGGDGGGGSKYSCNGGNGSYYGGGGGGKGSFYIVTTDYNDEETEESGSGDPGAGYQGVIYVRIPYEQ